MMSFDPSDTGIHRQTFVPSEHISIDEIRYNSPGQSYIQTARYVKVSDKEEGFGSHISLIRRDNSVEGNATLRIEFKDGSARFSQIPKTNQCAAVSKVLSRSGVNHPLTTQVLCEEKEVEKILQGIKKS